MAYPQKRMAIVQVGSFAEVDCASAAVQTHYWIVNSPCKVTRILGRVSTVMVSTGTVVCTFRRRPTFGSATGQASIGSITFAATAAADKLYYKNVTPLQLNPGDQIAVEVVTAATTSGKAIFDFEVEQSEEEAANRTNMVASA